MANSTKKNARGLNTQHLLNFEQSVLNMSLYNPVLAIGSGSKKKVLITTGATGLFLIEGKMYVTPASQEVGFTATTDDIVASATKVQERYYVVCLNTSGTGSIVAGDQADTGKALLPEIDSDLCAIGYVKLSVAAGAVDFDATTDELDEGHITDVYTNVALLAY
jgi:hypothetical protein